MTTQSICIKMRKKDKAAHVPKLQECLTDSGLILRLEGHEDGFRYFTFHLTLEGDETQFTDFFEKAEKMGWQRGACPHPA